MYIPSYAYSWRPFTSNGLIVKKINNSSWEFVIDPWTRRWAIVEGEVSGLLSMFDGKTRFSEILRNYYTRKQGQYANNINATSIAESCYQEGLIFDNELSHYKSGVAITNICDYKDITGLHIETTNLCNMQCSHCYVSAGKPLPNELNYEQILEVIDSLPSWSGKRVAVSGGEPALQKNAVDLLRYCTDKCGHDVDWYTNGKNFPKRLAKEISKINSLGNATVRIQLSLEGSDKDINDQVRGKGSFDAAVKSLEYFQEIGLNRHVILFVCATKNNISDIAQMICFAEKYDVAMLVFTQWQKQGYAAESLAPTTEDIVEAGEKLLHYKNPRLQVYGNFYGDLGNNEIGRFSLESPIFPKQIYCFNIVPRVTPDGNIFADQLWVDPGWVIGNVKDTPLAEAFSSVKFYEQYKEIKDRNKKISDCANCQWLNLCGGGSAGLAYAEYGDLNSRDSYCEVRKYWFERYVNAQLDMVSPCNTGVVGL